MSFYYPIVFSVCAILIIWSAFDNEGTQFGYWAIVVVLAALCLFKPFGVAPDDENYMFILDKLFSGSDSAEVLKDRDYIWSTSVLMLSGTLSGEFAIKAVAVISFLIKSIVINAYTKRRILCVSIYTSAFFVLFETIQYRASLAVAFFFLAILCFRKTFRSLISTALAALAHIQAVSIVPALILAKFNILNKRFVLFVSGMCILLPAIIQKIQLGRFVSDVMHEHFISDDVLKYFDVDKIYPTHSIGIILTYIVFFVLLERRKVNNGSSDHFIVVCMMLGFVNYALMVDIPDVRQRITELFFAPFCLLASEQLEKKVLPMIILFEIYSLVKIVNNAII